MNGTAVTAVAMSGGVDSSVAACLVARAGERVVGFSMQLVDRLAGETERYGRCCSPEDFRDARAVADRVGFPHYVLDLEEEFRRNVLEPFAADYCGRPHTVTLRALQHVHEVRHPAGAGARRRAERVATGHYAILEPDPRSGRTRCCDGRSTRRRTSPTTCSTCPNDSGGPPEFPLGRMSKSEVREVARENGLSTAEKPESMDLCFVARGRELRAVPRPATADRGATGG